MPPPSRWPSRSSPGRWTTAWATWPRFDAFQFSISREAEFPPNTVGRYRNSDPWTLGYIVQRTVENELGEEYLSWPQRALFDKIGIRRFIMETDPYGNFLLTGYNYGTARNWARFGMLYLNRGMWNGERLLTEEFVDFVRSPAPAWPEPYYGGQFWLNTADEEGRGGRIPQLPPDAYNPSGAGHQRDLHHSFTGSGDRGAEPPFRGCARPRPHGPRVRGARNGGEGRGSGVELVGSQR